MGRQNIIPPPCKVHVQVLGSSRGCPSSQSARGIISGWGISTNPNRGVSNLSRSLRCVGMFHVLLMLESTILALLCVGVVPANGRVNITVTFAPTEFNTAVLRLQVIVTLHVTSVIVLHFSLVSTSVCRLCVCCSSARGLEVRASDYVYVYSIRKVLGLNINPRITFSVDSISLSLLASLRLLSANLTILSVYSSHIVKDNAMLGIQV